MIKYTLYYVEMYIVMSIHRNTVFTVCFVLRERKHLGVNWVCNSIFDPYVCS